MGDTLATTETDRDQMTDRELLLLLHERMDTVEEMAATVSATVEQMFGSGGGGLGALIGLG